jgi:hypothetical protein
VRIGESGCALPTNIHGISDVWIEGRPRSVALEIRRNGRPFVARSLIPAYQESRPNGPGCEPVCVSAAYDLFQAD